MLSIQQSALLSSIFFSSLKQLKETNGSHTIFLSDLHASVGSAVVATTSATDYGYGPSPDLKNPNPGPSYKPVPAKPEVPGYKTPKSPEGKDKPLVPSIIGVQGVVLCESGSTYFPIQGNFIIISFIDVLKEGIVLMRNHSCAGAVVRVTCVGVDEGGYETAPMSVLSHITDSKGYFLATLSISEVGDKLKFSECRAFLESSPLQTCKVPTDENHGISGALLSSYRLLNHSIKLHSVGPFVYTSHPKPLPNGY